jgi:hypothetical protein
MQSQLSDTFALLPSRKLRDFIASELARRRKMESTTTGLQFACEFDMSGGRAGEMKFSSDTISVCTGTGIRQTSIWMQSVARRLDLRVVLRLSDTGLDVALERIEAAPVPSSEGKTYLRITVDPATGIASVMARGSLGDILLNQFPA